jgi:serine/threonine protein kinase
MNKLMDAKLDGFAQIISHGKQRLYYIVMKKYGPSLHSMIRNSKNKRLSIKTSIQIGLQLIDRLEALHKEGLIYNNLKPKNILLSSRNMKSLESSSITLIDFGYAKAWRDHNSVHIEEESKIPFNGN